MMIRVHALLTLCALLLLACNSDGTAACKTGDPCDTVMCAGSNATSFPTFDKTCMSATDCVIGMHQVNCCGAMKAIGMTQAEQARFAADEKRCVDQYQPCLCPTPTITEDGKSTTDPSQIIVECQSGQCMTTLR